MLAALIVLAAAPSALHAAPASAAACPPTPEPRVAVAGDSWAALQWVYEVHNRVFDAFGHGDKIAIGDLSFRTGYTISGSTTRQWVNSERFPWLDNLIGALNDNPTIDTVHLSIGGNDFLLLPNGEGGWYKGIPPDEEAAATQVALDNTETMLNAIRAVRPNIETLLVGYEYPNMFESGWLGDLMWAKMLEPTTLELNQAIVRLERRRADFAVGQERTYFSPGLGVTHHFFGYTGSEGPFFLPGVTPLSGQTPPDYSPFPGGDMAYPGSMTGMLDAIHLNEAGYYVLLTVHTQNYYLPRFRNNPDITLHAAGGLYDGWVRSDGQTSNEAIAMGDESADVDYRGLITFDASAIPAEALITSANLYLTRRSLTGANPFADEAWPLGRPVVDVQGGAFGQPPVEASDYSQAADAADAGCFVGALRGNGHLLRIDLTPRGLMALKTGNLVQFRVYFPNADEGSDVALFFDGDSERSAPFLDVHYLLPGQAPHATYLPAVIAP